MSHWQKVKTHNKDGQNKKDIERHFGIKSDAKKLFNNDKNILDFTVESNVNLEAKKPMVEEVKEMIKENPGMFEKLKDKKSKKKNK